eukprot:CAMPEP_0184032764 /NCGR_PEP_ID=MMETSP0955-20130417/3281_1 /TAXON_ID=627963 /ORGANISM="Aplanochytrium sp, Strain PBS07" /LENGTH=435 /DNA_ID=CAMNT_0026318933 /DNA_START=115 /DNA_END=1422 /DNA_ORIENTATION=+
MTSLSMRLSPYGCKPALLVLLILALSSVGARAQLEIVQKCAQCCKALEKYQDFKQELRHVDCINHGCYKSASASPDCKFSGYEWWKKERACAVGRGWYYGKLKNPSTFTRDNGEVVALYCTELEDGHFEISETKFPTHSPTKYPTHSPTKYPTISPTESPTNFPTNFPTPMPVAPTTPSPTETSAPTETETITLPQTNISSSGSNVLVATGILGTLAVVGLLVVVHRRRKRTMQARNQSNIGSGPGSGPSTNFRTEAISAFQDDQPPPKPFKTPPRPLKKSNSSFRNFGTKMSLSPPHVESPQATSTMNPVTSMSSASREEQSLQEEKLYARPPSVFRSNSEMSAGMSNPLGFSSSDASVSSYSPTLPPAPPPRKLFKGTAFRKKSQVSDTSSSSSSSLRSLPPPAFMMSPKFLKQRAESLAQSDDEDEFANVEF